VLESKLEFIPIERNPKKKFNVVMIMAKQIKIDKDAALDLAKKYLTIGDRYVDISVVGKTVQEKAVSLGRIFNAQKQTDFQRQG